MKKVLVYRKSSREAHFQTEDGTIYIAESRRNTDTITYIAHFEPRCSITAKYIGSINKAIKKFLGDVEIVLSKKPLISGNRKGTYEE